MLTRVISIGGATPTELLARLAQAGVQVNEIGRDLFRDPRFTTAPSARELELVVTTVAELGLINGGTYAQVLANAHLRGLAVCPLELAAHLRLQWPQQPTAVPDDPPAKHRAPSGSVTVAAEPPPDEHDLPWGFYLRRLEGEVWLRGYRSWSGHLWSPEDHFAFVRVKCGVGGNELRPSR